MCVSFEDANKVLHYSKKSQQDVELFNKYSQDRLIIVVSRNKADSHLRVISQSEIESIGHEDITVISTSDINNPELKETLKKAVDNHVDIWFRRIKALDA